MTQMMGSAATFCRPDPSSCTRNRYSRLAFLGLEYNRSRRPKERTRLGPRTDLGGRKAAVEAADPNTFLCRDRSEQRPRACRHLRLSYCAIAISSKYLLPAPRQQIERP